jgi:AcrR family transcriptional regulator
VPRTAQQFEEQREESRARILAHALELFAWHGYEGTSVRMIARAAGISQGLMYNYFASKDELLRAIFQRSVQDILDIFARATQEEPDPRRALERIIRLSFDTIRHHTAFWKLSYVVRLQPAASASLTEELPVWTESIRQAIEAQFRAIGVDRPATQAMVLFALIDGVGHQYVLAPESYPLAEVTEEIVATCCA